MPSRLRLFVSSSLTKASIEEIPIPVTSQLHTPIHTTKHVSLPTTSLHLPIPPDSWDLLEYCGALPSAR